MGDRLDIAVIGSGVSGLTAAHVLGRRHQVTLYERDERLGGHANTVGVRGEGGREVALDTGFIVHNERTYPTLLRLFADLGVRTQDSDMSFSVRCEGCGLEYAGSPRDAGRDAAGVRARTAALPADAGARSGASTATRAPSFATRPPTGSRSTSSWPTAATRTTSPTTSCCR